MDAIVGSHPNLNTFPDAADVPRENSPLSKSVGRHFPNIYRVAATGW